MQDRQGCLSGLLQLLALGWLFDFLQDNFGTGRGGVCGCGCGFVILLVFLALACSVLAGTNWWEFSF